MFSANLLVATGKPYENGQKIELINLIDPNIENEVLDILIFVLILSILKYRLNVLLVPAKRQILFFRFCYNLQ